MIERAVIPIPEKYRACAFVTIPEAMEILRTQRDSFYKYVNPAILRGEIASMLVGRKRLIRLDSLLAWANRRTQEGKRWDA